MRTMMAATLAANLAGVTTRAATLARGAAET
jgi:hypothetical protein